MSKNIPCFDDWTFPINYNNNFSVRSSVCLFVRLPLSPSACLLVGLLFCLTDFLRLAVCLFVSLYVFQSAFLSAPLLRMHVFLPSAWLFVRFSVYNTVCRSVSTFVCKSVYTLVFLSVCSIFCVPVCHSFCQDNLVLSNVFIIKLSTVKSF